MCIEFWKWWIYRILLPCGFFFFVNFATWNFVWSVLNALRFEIICTVNWLSIKEEITSSLHRVHQHSHSCGLHTLLFFLYTTPLSDIIASHSVNPSALCSWHHHHHHHQSLNREGRWGTTDDFATSFLHCSLFSTALWDLLNSRPVWHSTLKINSNVV